MRSSSVEAAGRAVGLIPAGAVRGARLRALRKLPNPGARVSRLSQLEGQGPACTRSFRRNWLIPTALTCSRCVAIGYFPRGAGTRKKSVPLTPPLSGRKVVIGSW